MSTSRQRSAASAPDVGAFALIYLVIVMLVGCARRAPVRDVR